MPDSAPDAKVGSAMTEIRHRTIESNGIRMHIAEAGEGPLVVLLHGFPESWYSWRHQLPALGDGRLPRGRAGPARLRPTDRARGHRGVRHPAPDRRYGRRARCARRRDGGRRRPRLGLAGRLELCSAHPDPLSRRRGTERAVHGARPDAAASADARHVRQQLLLHHLLPDTGRRRSGAFGRYASHLAQLPLRGVRRREGRLQ